MGRFGEKRTYRAGERLMTTGEISPGLFVVVSGEIPTGISGMALMARAFNQAQKLGAEMAIRKEVGEPRARR